VRTSNDKTTGRVSISSEEIAPFPINKVRGDDHGCLDAPFGSHVLQEQDLHAEGRPTNAAAARTEDAPISRERCGVESKVALSTTFGASRKANASF